MIQVKILAFAGARDVIGSAECTVQLKAGTTADQALAVICERFKGLEPFRSSMRVAINGRYANGDEAICGGDELALIPPVAGG